jgi:protein TonB
MSYSVSKNHSLMLLAALAAVPVTAAAQTAPVDNKVYTYVEKMPQLAGGGGVVAIVRAIQERVVYPSEALRAQAQGRSFVKFIVAADGTVRQAAIVMGFRPDCDSAVVQAVRQLPRFEPGIQEGKPVAVSFTAPVTFRITPPAPPKLGLIR